MGRKRIVADFRVSEEGRFGVVLEVENAFRPVGEGREDVERFGDDSSTRNKVDVEILVLFVGANYRIVNSDFAAFIGALTRLKSDSHHCSRCHCISDTPVCPICSSPKRNQKIICVVENIQEVMAIENTAQYNGLYHVLGGVISPLDGIGIADLTISQLLDRIAAEQTEEVILALPTTMEGDTTNIYIDRQLRQFTGLKVTTIARGIAIGDNLEYADEITLGRSIVNRVPFRV